MSDMYKSARKLAKVVTFAGWAIVALGGALLLAALISLGHGAYLGDVPGLSDLPLVLSALLLLATGLMLALFGPVSRAVMDTADHARVALETVKPAHEAGKRAGANEKPARRDAQAVPELNAQYTEKPAPAVRPLGPESATVVPMRPRDEPAQPQPQPRLDAVAQQAPDLRFEASAPRSRSADAAVDMFVEPRRPEPETMDQASEPNQAPAPAIRNSFHLQGHQVHEMTDGTYYARFNGEWFVFDTVEHVSGYISDRAR